MAKPSSTPSDILANTAGRGAGAAILVNHLRLHREAQRRLHDIILFGEGRSVPIKGEHPLVQVVLETAKRYSEADAAARQLEAVAREALEEGEQETYASTMQASTSRLIEAGKMISQVQSAVRDFMATDDRQFKELIDLMRHELKRGPPTQDAESELLRQVRAAASIGHCEPDVDPTAMGDEAEDT